MGGQGGVPNFNATRYYKAGVRQIRVEISTWGRGVKKMAPKIPTSFILIINSKKSAAINRDFMEIKLYAHYLLCLPEPERLDGKQFSCIEYFNGL